MQWKGPFTIVEKVGKVDYKIDIGGKLKTFYANRLKLYVERESDIDITGVAVVDIEYDDDGNETLVDSPREVRKEGPIDVTVSAELTDDQCNDVHFLLDEFSDVLSDLPGLTTLGVHQIKLTSDKHIRSKPYPLHFTSRDTVCEEVRKILEAGVVEPSDSPYSSPIVIVKNNRRGTAQTAFVSISELSTKSLCLTRKLFLILTISLSSLQDVNMFPSLIYPKVIGSFHLMIRPSKLQHSKLHLVYINLR